jgi:3-oxoacyl-[acyl-carrier protein] reductase
MEKTLSGQVALITGGSRGIGFALAEALVTEGISVAVTGRSEKHLADAKRRLDAIGGTVKTLAVDVRDYQAMNKAVSEVVNLFGGLDIVINNAALGTFVNVADMTPAQWSELIDTNLTGVFNVCSSAIPHLRSRGGGYVINISSLAGKNAFVGGAAYCATKAGLNAFGETLMQELRHENIKVTTIAPGSVATGFSSGDERKGADWKIAPSDIADIVLGLLRIDPRSLASYIELRPSKPPKK